MEIPYYAASDNFDGDVTDIVSITGLNDINTSVAMDYNVTFSVTDSSGNPSLPLTWVVSVEPHEYFLTGKAIDGYLSGSTVIFDSITDGTFDGQHDLNRSIVTDGSGSFSVKLSTSELQVFGGSNNILEESF